MTLDAPYAVDLPTGVTLDDLTPLAPATERLRRPPWASLTPEEKRQLIDKTTRWKRKHRLRVNKQARERYAADREYWREYYRERSRARKAKTL